MRFDEIHPEDFDGGFEENLVRETHRECEDVTWFIEGIHHNADPSATQIHGLGKEYPLGVVRLGLETHGQHDRDSVIGPAIGKGRWGVV